MSILTALSLKQIVGLGPAPGHGDHDDPEDHLGHGHQHLMIHRHPNEPVNHPENSTFDARAGAVGLHNNVNVLLAGIMLGGIVALLALLCYCCHRNLRKQAVRGEAYWREREPEAPLEVFTLDGRCYEYSGVFTTTDECSFENVPPGPPAPPPPYDAVVRPTSHHAPIKATLPKTKEDNATAETLAAAVRHQPYKIDESSNNANCEAGGLPTYEAALRLEALGYV